MSLWASLIVVVKKNHLKVHHSSPACVYITEIKLLVTGSHTSNGYQGECICTYAPAKIDELFTFLKGAKYFTALDLHSGYHHIKLDEESIP